MSTQTWALQPSGAVQDHVIADVYRQAVAMTKFMPFCRPVQVESGQSFTVPSRSSLPIPSSSALDELKSIPIQRLSITSKAINVTERGSGVEITRRAINRAPYDLQQEHRLALSEQMALIMDSVAAAGFKSGPLKYAATGAASQNLATGGTFGATANTNLNIYHIRKIRNELFANRLCPMFPDGAYRGLFASNSILGVVDDPDFLEINKSENSGIFSRFDAGQISDVILFENQYSSSLSNSIGSGSDVGEGVVFGRDACFIGFIEKPVILTYWDDERRFYRAVWFADWGVGIPSNSANAGLARIVHYGSL